MKGKKKGSGLPVRLERGRERFERWRASRQNRRIPEGLWKLAEGLATEFGVYQTSRALRLSYEDLKRRVRARRVGVKPRGGAKASPFVPLVPSGIVGGEGAAEYKGVDGSWMRVEWKGATPDLAQLSESFFFGVRS